MFISDDDLGLIHKKILALPVTSWKESEIEQSIAKIRKVD